MGQTRLMPLVLEQLKQAKAAKQQEALAAMLEGRGQRPVSTPGLGITEEPQTVMEVDPRARDAAGLARAGMLTGGEGLKVLTEMLGMSPESRKPIVVPKGASVLQPGAGGGPGSFQQAPRPDVAPFTPPPGFRPTYSVSAEGEQSTSWRPPEESEYERLAADILAGSRPDATPEQKAAAIRAQKVIDLKAQVGGAGGAARARVELELPLVQSLRQGQHIWDKQTGAEVNSLGISLSDARKDLGRYRTVDAKTRDQLVSIREATFLLDQFEAVVKQLTNQPGANLTQAASMYAQTAFGVDNPGVVFSAMEGTVLRLAGAMQGSRVQLSDQDRKAVMGMMPTPMDTIQSGLRRLNTVRGIFQAMADAQLGESGGLARANQALRSAGGSGTLGSGATGGGQTGPATLRAPDGRTLKRQPDGTYQ